MYFLTFYRLIQSVLMALWTETCSFLVTEYGYKINIVVFGGGFY
jgi:hypothetical protein